MVIFPLLVLLISHLTLTNSQTAPTDPSAPTITECGPSLLPLAPCGPFVQGNSPVTTLQCCQNLAQAYHDQPGCLCLFLNATALGSLPINTTRALQLPGLCDVHIDSSTCSSSSGGSIPSTPPTAPSQASFKNNPTNPTAGAPTVTVAPRPSTARFGVGQNSAYKLSGGALAPISLILASFLL